MKNRIATIFTMMFIAISIIACKDKAKEADTKEAEAAAEVKTTSVKYIANATASSIEWKGFKPTGTHNGTINIESGVFNTVDGNIDSGTFLINMKSITALDLEGKMKDGLESHLKGTAEGKEDHFFDVNKHPTGAFEVTGLESVDGKSVLSGNLTLKDTKQNISFPVTVTTEGDVITIASEAFTIDRTKWGVNYGSKSVFDDLGDKFVNDDIELKITVKATKS